MSEPLFSRFAALMTAKRKLRRSSMPDLVFSVGQMRGLWTLASVGGIDYVMAW